MSNARTLLVVLIYAAITLAGTAQADTGSAAEAHDAFLREGVTATNQMLTALPGAEGLVTA